MITGLIDLDLDCSNAQADAESNFDFDETLLGADIEDYNLNERTQEMLNEWEEFSMFFDRICPS